MSDEDLQAPRVKLKGRPSLDEAAAIDRAIKDAALTELLQKGEAATLNAVAQTAGLSRKTVYARYPSKTELFREAIREVLTTVEPLQFDCRGSLEDRIGNYIIAMFELLEKPHAKAFEQTLSMDPSPAADLHNEFVAASRTIFYQPLEAMLEAARQEGDIAPGEDIRELARLIMATSLMIGRVPEEYDDARWALQRRTREYAIFMSRVFCRGIANRG